MKQGLICLQCRDVFDLAPDHCPTCGDTTFVHFKDGEDANFLCDELLFVAGLAQLGLDQSLETFAFTARPARNVSVALTNFSESETHPSIV